MGHVEQGHTGKIRESVVHFPKQIRSSASTVYEQLCKQNIKGSRDETLEEYESYAVFARFVSFRGNA